MSFAWQREFTRLGSWLILWLFLGLLFGHVMTWLFVGSSLYLGWHLLQIYRLSRWLRDPKQLELPDGTGVWEDVYRAFRLLDRRNRRGQQRLENMVSQYEASTAALPDAIVVLDENGHIAWFNEAGVTLLGFRSPQDIGQRVVNLIRHPTFASHLQSGDYGRDIEIPSPIDSDCRLSVRIIPYGEDQRLVIARDISQQKRLEQMRRDFVANASHELRTPLTVLRGYLDMMAEEATAKGPLQPWISPINDMVRQATRMGNIIEDLLKLARIEANAGSARHETVQVPALLNKLVDEAKAVTGDAHAIHLEAEEGLNIHGHLTEIQSIFSNLIQNAAQYTPAGGDIRVRWWSDGAGMHFTVSDSGIGIDKKHIPRLTERFYRVDPSRFSRTGGTGLGLAIVKHALEHHGGQLEISSQINIGSKFTCHFPLERLRRLS